MSKPIHPIRKLATLDLWTRSTAEREKVIARHVKPLLDALEQSHDAAYDHALATCDTCSVCRLFAAWRVKL